MPTGLLRYLFEPASVALIGASDRPGSLGATLIRNLLAGGFTGELFLVNRRHRCVQGLPTFQHLSELPHAPELALLATPAPTLPALLAELDQHGAKVAVLVGPVGSGQTEGADPHSTRRATARPHGLRVLGPNSLGLMAPRVGLNASLGPLLPPAGPLALVAPSGMVLTPMLEWAASRGIGFSGIAALGDGSDIGFAELLDGCARDPNTRAILLYLETLPVSLPGTTGSGVAIARSFLSAARAAARVKPVLVVRAGRGGDVASRQTDAVYEAAFRRVGMLRVRSLRELCWAAETLALDLPASGDRLAIVGNSRGLGLLAADTLLAEGGRLARFAAATEAALRPILPGGVAPDNPLDLGGAADRSRFAAALDILLAAPETDGVLLLHAPNALVSAEDNAAAAIEAVGRHRARSGKRPSVLACWLGVDSARAARQRLLAERIPAYDTPDGAVRAFMRRWRHQQNRIALMETPPDLSERPDPAAARRILQQALAEGHEALAATETLALLAAYGISLQTAESGSTARPAVPALLELAVRTFVDPIFGPVLLLGPGGSAVVLPDDFATALPPLDPPLAREMIARTRIHRRLQGADTGGHGLLDRVILLLVKVAQLIVDLGEVTELELNPIKVTTASVAVNAARIRVATAVGPAHERLAIRPYPGELEETLPLPDGTTLLIRPVRPEDEPALIAGFTRLSREEVRMRFMHVFKELTHAEAARLTQLDYDRDMALVALRQRAGQAPEGCGVARISRDPDRERAEFAIILLRDATGIGLGSLLLRRLIDHARTQGIRELFGEILRDNDSMLELCRAMGFTVEVCPEDPGVMIATLPL